MASLNKNYWGKENKRKILPKEQKALQQILLSA